MKKFIFYLFVVVCIGEIVSIFLSIEVLHLLCKPLIMVTLGLFYLSNVSTENRSGSLILAIVSSFAGDVFLMLQNVNHSYFLMGLLSFLAAHVFYIIAYRQHRYEASANALQGVQRIRFAFPIILAGTGLIVVLYPALGDLKFPVMLYAGVLTVMVLNSLFRYGHTNTRSFWMVFGGAVLFLVSDSVLAINKFLQPVPNGIPIIMLTYIGGQFLIVAGLIEHSRKRKR
jgi:uncharacterized membrane protein YhhN